MSKVTFQLVLKECVLPDYFVFNKLKNLLAGRSEFSEFDMQQARDAIEILHYTNYEGINRFLLAFSVDFSIADTLGLDYTQKLILAFGNSFRDETETVEGIFRFQDDFMLDEIIEFHREIYQIEMQIREALNYILAYNFARKDLFNCIEEFEGIDFANERMKREEGYRRKVFNEFLEGEIFHIIFTRYSQFINPKKPKADKIFDFINQSNSFDELRALMQERGITENINPYHKTFIGELAANLQQIEDVRNEIMHNREVKESETNEKLTQKTGYLRAKRKFEDLIERFWDQEKNYRVEDARQIDYILKTLIKSITLDAHNTIFYNDLNFEEQIAESKEELISQFSYIVAEKLEIQDLDALERDIDARLSQIEELSDSDDF